MLELITISARKGPQAELKSLLPCCLPSICSVFPEVALVAILSLIIFLSQRMASLSPQPFLLQVNNCSSFHLSPLTCFLTQTRYHFQIPGIPTNCLLSSKLYKNASTKHKTRTAVPDKIPSHHRCSLDFFRSVPE